MSASWDRQHQRAQDEVDDARAAWKRYHRTMVLLVGAALLGGLMFVGACVMGGISSALGWMLGDVALGVGVPGCLMALGAGMAAGFIHDTTNPDPAAELRRAERSLRDLLMETGR